MKDILFVIPTLRMGGAEKSLVSLLKALDPTRVNVDLFLFEADGVLQSEVPDWVNIMEADPVTRGVMLELRYYLKDMLKRGHIKAAIDRLSLTVRSKFKKSYFGWEIVEKHIPKLTKPYDVAIGFLEGVPDYFVLDKVDAVKKIGWIHSDLSKRNLHEKEKEYYKKLDHLVTISEVCKNGFISLIPEVADRMIVLENIVLAEDVLKKAQEEPEEQWTQTDVFHLVSVGRLYHHKGMDVGARAAKILADRKIPICWHVYGEGVMKDEIQQYVEENELQDIFVLEGLRSNPYPYMRKADIIVQPSRLEGKSLVLDEAKILGKAIAVTNYPSVTDQIIHGKTGIITGMEPGQIADGIEMILKDTALRKELEKNSQNEENSSYSTVKRFYDLIKA